MMSNLTPLSPTQEFSIYLTAQPAWLQSAYQLNPFIRGQIHKAFKLGVPKSNALAHVSYELYLKLSVCESQIHLLSSRLNNQQLPPSLELQPELRLAESS